MGGHSEIGSVSSTPPTNAEENLCGLLWLGCALLLVYTALEGGNKKPDFLALDNGSLETMNTLTMKLDMNYH